jgi:beta-galactosidase
LSTRKANENATLEQIIKVNKPDLWSVETPTLYTAVSENFYRQNSKDEYENGFGFRTIRFDKDKGFF